MAEHNPDVIRRIDEAGHEIGNHGYTHERFVEKTVEEQLEILKKDPEDHQGHHRKGAERLPYSVRRLACTHTVSAE